MNMCLFHIHSDSRKQRGDRRKTISNPQTPWTLNENDVISSDDSNSRPRTDLIQPNNNCQHLITSTQSRDTSTKVIKLISRTIRLNLKDQMAEKVHGQMGSYEAGDKIIHSNDINAPLNVKPKEKTCVRKLIRPKMHVGAGGISHNSDELCYWNIPPSTTI